MRSCGFYSGAVYESAGFGNASGADEWRMDIGTVETETAPETLDFGFFIPQVSIYYGQQLKAAALSGTATNEQGQTVNGTFSWLYPETVMEQLGTVTAEAVFTRSAG